jgi:hypothetical protein
MRGEERRLRGGEGTKAYKILMGKPVGTHWEDLDIYTIILKRIFM